MNWLNLPKFIDIFNLKQIMIIANNITSNCKQIAALTHTWKESNGKLNLRIYEIQREYFCKKILISILIGKRNFINCFLKNLPHLGKSLMDCYFLHRSGIPCSIFTFHCNILYILWGYKIWKMLLSICNTNLWHIAI